MDPWQIVNGCAALIAFGSSQMALVQIQPSGRPAVMALHVIHSTILLWYAVVNLWLGFGIGALDTESVIPLFRYAFAPLLLTYAARQYAAARSVVHWNEVVQ